MNFLLFSFISLLFIQQPAPVCKVITEEINETYEGECRLGLAHGFGVASGKDLYEGNFRRGRPHGMGTYTWSSGETYIGKWKKGLKHGKGLKINENKDTLAYGLWKDGSFLRETNLIEKLPDYVVRYKRNITRLRFINLGEGNQVYFVLNQGRAAQRISHLSVFGNSGQYIGFPNKFGFEKITFPFQGRVVFYGYSRTGFTVYQIELTLEINTPGNWEVHISY